MILAAGLGTRLGPITKNKPKCLVEVGGKAIIEWVIERLQAAGVTELIINLHYLSDQVQAFFCSRKFSDLRVQFAYEPLILGTGGGVKNVREFFRGSRVFFVHNADLYTTFDLQSLLAEEERSGCLAALAVSAREEKTYLLMNEDRQLVGLQRANGTWDMSRKEIGQPTRFAFCGIHLLSERIFEHFDHYQREFSVIDAYLKAAARGEVIKGVEYPAESWVDIGTPETLEALNRRLTRGTGN